MLLAVAHFSQSWGASLLAAFKVLPSWTIVNPSLLKTPTVAVCQVLPVQMVIGGTNINRERTGLNTSRCDVLIATPGRLQDHIDSTQGFAGRLWGAQVLVLDEVDRLLDMGFRPAIEAIMRYLPPPGQRQALMYSATLPKGVNDVASSYMRGDYVHVNTVSDDDRPSHESIVQEYMVVQPEALMHQLMSVIKAHMQEEPNSYKVGEENYRTTVQGG
eukprot:GHUV01042257.1.p1 GENE.GHUV01042257.1~~GHUV01042257.1.p1  ORF type:complete len:216 (+),score=53.51 GHUV01042257.1:201-848(+)